MQIIFDGHNDSLLRFCSGSGLTPSDIAVASRKGHFDIPRAHQGRFVGGFFALFIPNPGHESLVEPKSTPDPNWREQFPVAGRLDQDYAQERIEYILGQVDEMTKLCSGKITLVRSIHELDKCLHDDKLAMILHYEGAEAIKSDLSNLGWHYARGLRSLGIVWSRPNDFGFGVPFKFNHSPDIGSGLTPAGFDLVRQCNDLGIILDLSHLNQKGFYDVLRTTRAPLVVTHSAVHRLCPSTRNLTDDQIDALGESGGVIGVNFFVADLRSDGRVDVKTPVSEIVRHITYIAERIGIDHVAFGSDFDGAMISSDIGDVSGLPKVISELITAGFDSEAIAKIACGNWLRVIRQTWPS